MSLQILDIVLYSYDGERRSVSLRPGRLNIITGASKTGKTALIEIIDYCLGSSACGIWEGIIRRSVEWVGLRLQVAGGEAFVARRLPARGENTSFDVYYALQRQIALPDHSALRQTINLEALTRLLSQHVGIGENIHEPPQGQTRSPVSATIRHALFFTFQQQGEVISNAHLFHKQSEQFIPQAIKDVLPYFLGAAGDDHVAKMSELRVLRRDLRTLEMQLAEHEAIRGRGVSRAQTLLAEAQDIGILDTAVMPDGWEACIDALRQAQAQPPEPEREIEREGDAFERLQQERAALGEELQQIKEQLAAAQALAAEREAYTHEAGEHLQRLRSIELFSDPTEAPVCPLCRSALSDGVVPAVLDLEHSIQRLDSQVRAVEERSPQMQGVVRTLQQRMDEVRGQLRANREALEAVQLSNRRLQEFRDRAARRAHVLGRIGLYLESLPQLENASQLRQDIEALAERVAILEGEVSNEVVRDRLDSMLSIVAQDMSEWARRLRLEHSEHPLRLDVRRLTVVADTADGPIPMERMGSGANWVGYHLVTHLALHKWFVTRNRPVPRFLFIDQPSQAYFPADTDADGSMEGIADEDRQAVARMYQLTLDVVQALSPGLQVIMTDHADIAEDWFQEHVVERWRGGRKLVPDHWRAQWEGDEEAD